MPARGLITRVKNSEARLIYMATKYIVGSVAASFAFAYACGVYLADRKVLGGEMPRTTVSVAAPLLQFARGMKQNRAVSD
jgi:hypothetical protein